MLPIVSKIRDQVANIDTQFPGNSFMCQRVSFIWFGMWPPLNNWNEERHFLTESPRFYRFYSIVLLGCFVYVSIAFQIIGILMVNNIDDLVTAAFSLLTLTTTMFKVTRFNLQYRKIRDLLETLNAVEFRPKDDQEDAYLRTAINRTFYTNFIYVLVCFLVLGQWIVLSAMNGTLMFRAWYPWDVTARPLFILTSIYQAVYFFVLIVTSSAIDNFVVGLVLHIHAQVRRLGYRLSQIGHGNEAAANEEMVACIKFHQKLLGCVHC
jgi:7tm Odorant receptor